jgi:ABC-2 type transport system ATP-binding protein
VDTSLAVRARGITKCFGDVVALDGVDLDVAPGRVHGLVGPNGAGKTTLFGLLLGLAVADGGSLEILGATVRPYDPPGRGGQRFLTGAGTGALACHRRRQGADEGVAVVAAYIAVHR